MRRNEDGQAGVAALIGIGAIFLTIFLVILFSVGIFALNWFTAPARGKLEAREQINSGDFRIEAYDRFFNECSQVRTNEAALAASREELQTATDPTDINRIRINITGQKVAVAEGINQYNADARKSYTAGQFRDNSLPYQIAPYNDEGDLTSCD